MTFVERISGHRSILMALAIAAIVVYHFKCWVNGLPWYVGIILQYGYIGVDLFFFISGLGIGYSYEKNSLGRFYLNRARRVLPSYFLYAIILVLVIFYGGKALSVMDILYKLSLLEYINNCGGTDWYISTILILYILFPILFRIVQLTQVWFVLLVFPVVFFISIIIDFHWVHQAAIQRIPMFVLGIWCAINKKNDKQTKIVFTIFAGYFMAFFSYIVLMYGAGSIISGNVRGMAFLLTDMFLPLLLFGLFNEYIYNHSYQFLLRLHKLGGVKMMSKNTLQIYYGTNLAYLSYDYFIAPRSIMAIVFILALIFGTYLFSWFTNKSNLFFSRSHI